MSEQTKTQYSRRQVLKTSGQAAAATALSTSLISRAAYASENNTINLALVGCGGRGTGAASDALSTKFGPVRLVAMADVFQDRLNGSYNAISKDYDDKIDVPEERRFIGFDAYRQAMDALNPGDVVILTTPPAFRWVHFTYAIERGLNVFMEKPISVDGPSSRRMLELGKQAESKNLKVGVGLMCRHCHARRELFDNIQDGQIGELTLLRAYRAAGPTGSAFVGPRPQGMNELEFQIRNFHAFLWASGGGFSDFLIHNIDECCWMKDDWPVEAKGFGGRHYRMDNVDQNFDTYTCEYTFKDGSKLMLEGRCMVGCHNEFASYAHGTNGSAIISTSSHRPSRARMYTGQRFHKDELSWAYPQPEPNPYREEWNDLIEAIRQDKPYNEVERGAMASLVTAMGRLSCHTGQVVTLDQAMAHEHEFAPDVDKLVLGGEAPLQADKNGRYPIPMPGLNKRTEYV